MKILLITYYWPPASSVGVRRWLRFVQYLNKSDYNITIVCPEGASYPSQDEQLPREIDGTSLLPVPIWEWRDLYDKLTGSTNKKRDSKSPDKLFYTDKRKQSSLQRLSLWIRANIVVPDARASWIKPCTRAINSYLKTEHCDLIISTGPPHSCHVIGAKIKASHPKIKWLVDFRDPWTGGANFGVLPLTSWGRKKHLSLEQRVLRTADIVTTVSWTWQEQLRDLGAKDVRLITNGYDPKDFAKRHSSRDHNTFTISHVGTLFSDRAAAVFWETVSTWVSSHSDIKKRVHVRLVGRISEDIASIVHAYHLDDHVTYVGSVSPAAAITEIKSADCLLLIVNKSIDYKGRIPAKVYEYLAADKPIILVGPSDADIHLVIPHAIRLDPEESLSERVESLTDLIVNRSFANSAYDDAHKSAFEIRALTQKLELLLSEISSKM